MEVLTQQLLNNFQRDFPLTPYPFAQIANSLNTDTDVILQNLQALQLSGVVSRIGPVFKPNTVGASTLATISVDQSQLTDIAEIVSQFPEVNHNYEREHHFNLWFVVTAADQATLQTALEKIEQATHHHVLSLPMIKDYHIDLGFNMQLESKKLPTAHLDDSSTLRDAQSEQVTSSHSAELTTHRTTDLIGMIQGGLPLVERPYKLIGERLSCSEENVIENLRDMLTTGVIKRLGVVVRHHELGYKANAMVVWDVADHAIDKLGNQMGDQDGVTLCYQRPRALPTWPYNLFCMIHGCDRAEVLERIKLMAKELKLEHITREILFSGRRFKQRGAVYRLQQGLTN